MKLRKPPHHLIRVCSAIVACRQPTCTDKSRSIVDDESVGQFACTSHHIDTIECHSHGVFRPNE